MNCLCGKAKVQKRWAVCVHFEARGLCATEFAVSVATQPHPTAASQLYGQYIWGKTEVVGLEKPVL